MALNIEIRNEHAREMIKFYVEKQKNIKTQIFQLEQESKEISAIIQQLNKSLLESSGEIKPLPQGVVYSNKWPWIRKIKFAIEQSAKPITTREIVDLLSQYEPEILYNRKKSIASVSSTLSLKTGSEFDKTVSESGENAYHLIDSNKNKSDTHYGTKIQIDDDLPF